MALFNRNFCVLYFVPFCKNQTISCFSVTLYWTANALTAETIYPFYNKSVTHDIIKNALKGLKLVIIIAQITHAANAGVAIISVMFVIGFVLFCKTAKLNK